MDCGPTCIRMIAKWYGRIYSLRYLKSKAYFSRLGVSLAGISACAESIGFRSVAAKVSYKKLHQEAPLPLVAHWQQKHFIVVYEMKKGKVCVADPAGQKVKLSEDEFMRGWASTTNSEGKREGIVLLMEPTPEFYSKNIEEKEKSPARNFTYLYNYFKKYHRFIWQLVIGLLVGSMIQLTLPFLTQAIVDVGINTRKLNFIYIVLAAQLMLFFSKATVDFIRRWILLHLSTRVNIALVSDFLIKMMRVPLSFFDSRMIGDIMQRINDHSRVQNFLSSSSLSILFSAFNVVVFGLILLFYNSTIFFVFFIGSTLYITYVIQFLKKREELDYKRFSQQSSNQSTLIQLITGISEIKLYGAERAKRWEWERIQGKLFSLSIASTKLSQWQEAGSFFLNELKNIIITVLAAKAVIDGQMTLGMMLAVQYIIGQLNGPINEFLFFIQQWQDAKISFQRIGEVHEEENEEDDKLEYEMSLPNEKSIEVQHLSFRYNPQHEPILKDISLTMQAGTVTAIVGTSGSGKTTLLKLLLKFYNPENGTIKIGKTDLGIVHSTVWRNACGVVMQDGFIFSDTISRNIALGDDDIDQARLIYAAQSANILDFIRELPLGFNTKIGQEGVGMSQGQKQRILIARAIYKNPNFLFFDEATSSLDANNERLIMQNLEQIYKGRTVLVIAHRLSTVKNADQVLVMEDGTIVESGSHHELVKKRGAYFNLVKNQLELGK